MSIFPDKMNIQIVDKISKNPIPNIVVTLKLFASSKNNYNFVLPISDENGYIKISKDWLEKEISIERSLFIMDYSSMLEDCKPQIQISVLDSEAISRAVNAMYLYQDVTGLNDEEISKLKAADNSKYFPSVEKIKLGNTKTLNIDLTLKSRK